MCVCVCVCVCVFVFACMYVCVCVCIHIHTHTCAHTHTPTHAHAHTHTHTHTHALQLIHSFINYFTFEPCRNAFDTGTSWIELLILFECYGGTVCNDHAVLSHPQSTGHRLRPSTAQPILLASVILRQFRSLFLFLVQNCLTEASQNLFSAHHGRQQRFHPIGIRQSFQGSRPTLASTWQIRPLS